MHTTQYAPGRSADVFGLRSQPPVLLWHGTQTDARAAVRPLAVRLTELGVAVVAPDWDSHADDGGRSDLLHSVDFVRAWSDVPDRLALVGWSLGAVAAAGLTIEAAHYDVVVSHTVCLAGAFTARDPISGDALRVAARADGSAFTLLHGRADDVVPPAASHTFAAALQERGWPVQIAELAADHGSIAGARYDAAADRYSPAEDPTTRRVVRDVAGHIATAMDRSGCFRR
ncbi:alpha/beta hydrolase [Mycolicibacterium sp. CR10]|uniref:alpha/beta hydrolase n=1 Tax=Mycolicibacterium sp. CR10 TaxID=2562314 RepID=UPI0010C06447|nr:alpha/beta fold hydrolase [Mycolicibacterium sp. CR10]